MHYKTIERKELEALLTEKNLHLRKEKKEYVLYAEDGTKFNTGATYMFHVSLFIKDNAELKATLFKINLDRSLAAKNTTNKKLKI